MKKSSSPDSRIVVDTNVFVAAGFNPKSHSAQIVRQIQAGNYLLIWNRYTRQEIEHTVGRIPVLSNRILQNVFQEEARHDDDFVEEDYSYISDPADRHFAALAVATDAPLISSDDHLLTWRKRLPVAVLSPGDFMRRLG